MIFGIQKFTDALWKVLRESEAFFPMPLAIERKCREISKFEHSQKLIDGYRRDDEHRKANPEEYIHLATDPDFQAIRQQAVKRKKNQALSRELQESSMVVERVIAVKPDDVKGATALVADHRLQPAESQSNECDVFGDMPR